MCPLMTSRLPLTPKGFLLCFHPTAILVQVPNFRKKNTFGHMQPYNLVVGWFENMWKKFQKFPPCRLQDISV